MTHVQNSLPAGLEDAKLPDRGDGDAVPRVVETDLLQGDDLARRPAPRLVCACMHAWMS